jgi:hypothetical protein
MPLLSARAIEKVIRLVVSSSTGIEHRMDRRHFIAGTGALLVSPGLSWAQGLAVGWAFSLWAIKVGRPQIRAI